MAIHDVLADEATGYLRQESVASGDLDCAHDLDLGLTWKGDALVADRLPGRAAYPRQSGPARLCTLRPGEIATHRANSRFTVTTCACNPSWYYEDWLIFIGHGKSAPDAFTAREPDHAVDHRVHLYGGARRRIVT
ncbi:hypothetical protein [Actinoplanes sp. TFC3]|uniref:hypothetical protein n=1 Tax=Actinoplanes sp. TFC3 TaxID=1710355 RepID=UPI001F1FFC94|nr:hypothetical protein [Actinoplanes sp. TFC3]